MFSPVALVALWVVFLEILFWAVRALNESESKHRAKIRQLWQENKDHAVDEIFSRMWLSDLWLVIGLYAIVGSLLLAHVSNIGGI